MTYVKKGIRKRWGEFAEAHTKFPVSFVIRLLCPLLGFKITQKKDKILDREGENSVDSKSMGHNTF